MPASHSSTPAPWSYCAPGSFDPGRGPFRRGFVYPLANFDRLPMPTMKNLGLLVAPALITLLAAGCAQTPKPAEDAPGRAQVDRSEPVRTSGREAAVLSVHRRTAFEDACTYGVTLTNNLPFKITNIAFRFAAHLDGGVFYQHRHLNFFELDATNSQYRELTFPQIRCDQIAYIEVSDPGRCAMGKLTKFSSNPGDCIRYIDIAPSPHVRLVRK